MQQEDAAKISNKILADKMNILKKGRTFETMCREIEKLTADVTAKVAAKVTAEEQKKAIKKWQRCVESSVWNPIPLLKNS